MAIGLLDQKIAISTDGRGAWRDSLFVERLRHPVNCREVYLQAYDSVSDARVSRGRCLNSYNVHSHIRALGGRTPVR